MNRLPDPRSTAAIAERLKALRNLYEMNQRTFADYVGISPTTWNNYERAGSQPDHIRATLIVAKTGVTLDWLYSGVVGTLPTSLSAKLMVEVAKLRSSGAA